MPRKPKPASKRGPGQPSKIDMEKLETLCQVNCTHEEIAAFFGITVRAIEKRRHESEEFRNVMDNAKLVGKISIRRAQVQAALNGDRTMLVWMGKQLLGQRDVQAMQISGPNDGPIEHRDVGMDLSKLSADELRTLRTLREKASAESGEKA
jgi:hypothetical protein